MKGHSRWILPVYYGSIAGLLVLGVGGRAAMAALSTLLGSDPNLSLPGFLESMLMGVVVGAIGGLLLPVVRQAIPHGRRSRAVVLGAVLFLFSLVGSWFTGRLVLRPELSATLIVAAAAFLVYGILVEGMLPATPQARRKTRSDHVPLHRIHR